MRSKKGDAWEATNFQMYLMFSIPIALALVFVHVISGGLLNEGLADSPPSLEKDIIEERFISCFAYYDDTLLREYQMIDIDKFNEKRLDECINISSYDYMLQLEWSKAVYGGKTIKTEEFEEAGFIVEKDVQVFDGNVYNGTLHIMYDEKERN